MTLSNPLTLFERPQRTVLERRLLEPRRFIQVVAGPRQVGKTTLAQQVAGAVALPVRFVSADGPGLRGTGWLAEQWELARLEGKDGPSVLVVDEVQKAAGWAEAVKRLWDEDSVAGRELRVVLLGSAPWLIEQSLTESLAGRFEIIRLGHWPLDEMQGAFGFDLDRWVHFGGYPGSAALVDDEERWSAYIRDALIETTVARDVLLSTRIDKPALLRRVFELACRYSGRILSYTKMLGSLQDAGNTTTLAHYLEILERAGLVRGLQKYAGDVARRRGSSPKLQVFNNALVSAQSGLRFSEARRDPSHWGRLVESAVGVHLANAAAAGAFELFYWRHRDDEVDFVARHHGAVTAIEVKSAPDRSARRGLDAFRRAFDPERTLTVGGDGIALERFLASSPAEWIA